MCDMPRRGIPAKLTVRHGRKTTTVAPYVDNLRVKLSPWPRYRLVDARRVDAGTLSVESF